jgi:hypothetical protein
MPVLLANHGAKRQKRGKAGPPGQSLKRPELGGEAEEGEWLCDGLRSQPITSEGGQRGAICVTTT